MPLLFKLGHEKDFFHAGFGIDGQTYVKIAKKSVCLHEKQTKMGAADFLLKRDSRRQNVGFYSSLFVRERVNRTIAICSSLVFLCPDKIKI